MNFDYGILDESEKMIFALRKLYQSYGYVRYRMSKFEEYDLYGRNKDFLISDGVITFTDTNGKLMALKPDVTLSIIKNNKDRYKGVTKLCYNENVYRVSKGTGSFREIMQTGLECFGDVDDSTVSEVIMLAAKSLETVSSEYFLDVSDVSVLQSIISAATSSEALKYEMIRLIAEKNSHGLSELFEENCLPKEVLSCLNSLMTVKGDAFEVIGLLDSISQRLGINADTSRLKAVFESLAQSGASDRVRLDFSVSDNINYYNGIVFKGFVSGASSSVLSGGQYDGLMKKMNRKDKAIGFAVYLDKLERFERER